MTDGQAARQGQPGSRLAPQSTGIPRPRRIAVRIHSRKIRPKGGTSRQPSATEMLAESAGGRPKKSLLKTRPTMEGLSPGHGLLQGQFSKGGLS
jgi:hypothetical protein